MVDDAPLTYCQMATCLGGAVPEGREGAPKSWGRIPWWCRGLRIWSYHCCGEGSIPGPGNSTCHVRGQKQKQKKWMHTHTHTHTHKAEDLMATLSMSLFTYVAGLYRWITLFNVRESLQCFANRHDNGNFIT